jgi:hypothetical protein
MDGMELALRAAGYGPTERDLVRAAIEARLRDAKAILFGGTLRDGTTVPGLAAAVQAAQAQARELAGLRAEIRELRELVKQLKGAA